MVSQAFADVETRHRLLEGFLLRLSRQADADAFALRGGMLVRQWFPNGDRPARDIDLVCALPYDPSDLRERIAKVLATPCDDGVELEPERFRLDLLWPQSRQPGMRLFAAGLVDGKLGEMSLDLTFHLDVWPQATREDVSLERGEARLWLCQPEMIVARKLIVTAEQGRRRWRPKDLVDMWWMLRELDIDPSILGDTIERTVPSGDAPHVPLAALLDRGWWEERVAMSRWGRCLTRDFRYWIPRDPVPVVEEVSSYLTSVI